MKHQTYAQGEWLYEAMNLAVQTVKDRTKGFDDHFYDRPNALSSTSETESDSSTHTNNQNTYR